MLGSETPFLKDGACPKGSASFPGVIKPRCGNAGEAWLELQYLLYLSPQAPWGGLHTGDFSPPPTHTGTPPPPPTAALARHTHVLSHGLSGLESAQLAPPWRVGSSRSRATVSSAGWRGKEGTHVAASRPTVLTTSTSTHTCGASRRGGYGPLERATGVGGKRGGNTPIGASFIT